MILFDEKTVWMVIHLNIAQLLLIMVANDTLNGEARVLNIRWNLVT